MFLPEQSRILSLQNTFSRFVSVCLALLIVSGCGIRITAPPDGSQFAQEDQILLKGSRRLGAPSAHDFKWRSSIDGLLGSGDVLLIPDPAAGRGPLSVGQHTVTAKHPGIIPWLLWRDSISLTVVGCLPAKSESDVTTGSPGSIHQGQSFNETRAVDVTLLGGSDRIVYELTLRGLNAFAPALVGARIYNSATQALISSSDVNLLAGSDMTATISMAATLAAGQSYRIGFYVETDPPWQASGQLFKPDAFSSLGNPMPYTEGSGVFQINSAHAISSDSFPANPSIATPQMTIVTRCP